MASSEVARLKKQIASLKKRKQQQNKQLVARKKQLLVKITRQLSQQLSLVHPAN